MSTAPRFTKKPSLRQEGSNIFFNCEIQAAPEPQVAWYRDGARLSDSPRVQAKVEKGGAKDIYSFSLVLSDVVPDDSGTYKVEAKNKLGQMSGNLNLNMKGMAQTTVTARGGAPSFLQKPAIRQVDGGKKILFECKISADPQPVLTWFRENIQLSEGGRYRYITKEENKGEYYIALELSDPQAIDAATYRLNAKNTSGESNANLKLNFDASASAASAPKFTSKPAIKQAGSGVVFEVSVQASPSPTITWFKGETIVQSEGRYNISTQTDGLNYVLLLEISSVTVEDGGTYRVSAKNTLGESNANLNLNLAAPPKQEGYAPKFLEKPSIKAQGGMVIMSVLVSAKPEPDMRWYKETVEIFAGGRLSIRKEAGSQADSYLLICEIKEMNSDDKAKYKCAASNALGTSNANLTLNIEAPPPPKPQKPKIHSEPSIKFENSGRRICIELVIVSIVKPQIIWSFKGTKITKTGRYFVDIARDGDNYVAVLEVEDAVKTDSGEYMCTITNESGEIIKTVTVTGAGEQVEEKIEIKKVAKKKKVPTATLR